MIYFVQTSRTRKAPISVPQSGEMFKCGPLPLHYCHTLCNLYPIITLLSHSQHSFVSLLRTNGNLFQEFSVLSFFGGTSTGANVAGCLVFTNFRGCKVFCSSHYQTEFLVYEKKAAPATYFLLGLGRLGMILKTVDSVPQIPICMGV